MDERDLLIAQAPETQDEIRARVLRAAAAGQAAANAQLPQNPFDTALQQSRDMGANAPHLASGLLEGVDAMRRIGSGNAPNPFETGDVRSAVPVVTEAMMTMGAPGTSLGLRDALMHGVDPNTVGVFAGRGAVGANEKARLLAGRLTKAGAPDSEVWQQTGWARGPDGRQRFEIPDTDARFKMDLPEAGGPDVTTPLSDVLHHPKLFEAYPDLAHVQVQRYGEDAGGSYMPASKYGPEGITVGDEVADKRMLNVLMHEIQHAVAHREGFELGSNGMAAGIRFQRDNLDPFDQSLAYLRGDRRGPAFQKYEANAGEVEARNVEHRLPMTPEQLRATPPIATEDVPRNVQWLENGPGVPMTDAQRALYYDMLAQTRGYPVTERAYPPGFTPQPLPPARDRYGNLLKRP